MKRYKHVGNRKVYCYRWCLATPDGTFQVMSYTSKPKFKNARPKRIKGTFRFMHPDRINGFYGFDRDYEEYQKMIEETFPD